MISGALWSRVQTELKMLRGNRLTYNAGWMFLGQGFSIACQAVNFVLLARLLGSTQYGIYCSAFAMVAILSTYSPLGSQFTLLRYVSTDPQKFALYWGNVLSTTITLGGLFVGLLVWTTPGLGASYPWSMMLCVALGDCLCGQLTMSAGCVFQAFEKMRVTAFLNLLTNFLRAMLSGVLLLRLHHATAQQWVFVTLAVSSVACILALTIVTRCYGKPAFSIRLMRNSVGEGFVFALTASTCNIYNNVDKAMLGFYGMSTANGIYSMAYRMIDLSMMPIAALHNAAFPRFFKKGKGGAQSTRAYALRILRRTAPVGMLLSASLFVVAPVVPFLAGRSFGGSVTALRWLCLLPFFRSFQWSAGDALTGCGRLRLRLDIQVVAAAFNFGINLYLIPHYGWLGAAWSSLATDGLLGVANWAALLVVRSQSAVALVAEG